MQTLGYYTWLTKPALRQGNRDTLKTSALLLSGMSPERAWVLANLSEIFGTDTPKAAPLNTHWSAPGRR